MNHPFSYLTDSIDFSQYRPNAGALILNHDGLIFMAERADIPDAWQMPQGGIEQDEPPLDAMLREIYEETTIPPTALKVMHEHSHWLTYDLPPEALFGKDGNFKKGQAQLWFVFNFVGNDAEINLDNAQDREFINWDWMTSQQALEKIISFKKPIYKELFATYSDLLA